MISWLDGSGEGITAQTKRARLRGQSAHLRPPTGAARRRRRGHGPTCQRGRGGNNVRGRNGGLPGGRTGHRGSTTASRRWPGSRWLGQWDSTGRSISPTAVRKGPTIAKWRGPCDGEVAGEDLGCDWGGDAVFCSRDEVVKLVS
jgi:hypothetical protein